MKLIGVIHLLPLPGSPGDAGMDAVLAAAVEDARAWVDGGADALIVENFGDVPFHATAVEPITVAAMTRATERIVGLAGGRPVGVNVLRNDAISALSVAHACGASFIRVNVHVGAAVTDQGVIMGAAAQTLRLRSHLDAKVEVWADVGVKHAVPLGEVDLAREAQDAVKRGLADALIVTGPATGERPELTRLDTVRSAVPDAKLLVGSGVTPDLGPELRTRVDGAIVGTWVKRDGRVDAGRVGRLRRALDG